MAHLSFSLGEAAGAGKAFGVMSCSRAGSLLLGHALAQGRQSPLMGPAIVVAKSALPYAEPAGWKLADGVLGNHRALRVAGIVEGYLHLCRRCKARGKPHEERHEVGTPVVQRGPEVGEPQYVGVREFARLLGVSTATVYKAVARGEVGHVRVSSVIRSLVGSPQSRPADRPSRGR